MSAAGVVYVIDSVDNRVQYCSAAGAFLGAWGGAGNRPGEFDGPEGIAVDSMHGVVYVADGGNRRIQIFDLEGSFVATVGAFGNDPGEFRLPSGVALKPNDPGFVYVSDALADLVSGFCPVLP